MANIIQRAALAVAKLAGYNAALPNKVQSPSTRIGTNPNSSYSQQQRLRLSIEGENAVKNTPFGVNYIYTRRAYCSGQIAWNPDTGDAALDEEVANVCNAEWSDMGIECSMQDAFSRVADVYLPVSGDSALQWYRDLDRLRLLEITADRIGEQFALSNVIPTTADIDGVKVDGMYIAGTLWAGPKIAAYKIYQRNGDASYVNPDWIPARNIIFFKDDITGGVRGVSKFAAALEDVNSRYQILKSTKDTMQMQSKIAAIASNNSGSPSEYDFQTVQGTDGTIDYVESFADGAVVKYQFNGDSYQVLKSETPSDSFLSGLKYVDAQASLAMGMSPAFLIGSSDFGGASVRLEIEKASREITRIREHVHRPRLNKIAYVTIMDLVARGKLPAKANITRGSWHFGTLPTADAFRDSKADIDSIRAGTTTRGRVIAANSGDTFPRTLRQTTQETVAIHKAVQDANRELERSISPIDGKPYMPTASIVDIALSTDNPPQTAPASQPDKPASQISQPDENGNLQSVADAAVAENAGLNGAQVTALIDVLGSVSTGAITESAGVEIIQAAFPSISREQVVKIMSGAITQKPENTTNPAASAAPASA